MKKNIQRRWCTSLSCRLRSASWKADFSWSLLSFSTAIPLSLKPAELLIISASSELNEDSKMKFAAFSIYFNSFFGSSTFLLWNLTQNEIKMNKIPITKSTIRSSDSLYLLTIKGRKKLVRIRKEQKDNRSVLKNQMVKSIQALYFWFAYSLWLTYQFSCIKSHQGHILWLHWPLLVGCR